MATAKTAAPATETVEMKTITIPRARYGEDPIVLVGINGVNYQIPRGKSVEVPAFVAEEYERSKQAEENFLAIADDMTSAYAQRGRELHL